MSANYEVIILAQGTQKRLRGILTPKQLLPLPACGGAPIMVRTVSQLLLAGVSLEEITIVGWSKLADHAAWRESKPRIVELPDPGNSSLKGIARYLEDQAVRSAGARHTIVLLGDVVYSWACLRAVLNQARTYGFVGTEGLCSGGGELWAVAWSRDSEDAMIMSLRDALLRHPPFDDEYQPGQLRRWITGFRRGDLKDHVAKGIGSGTYWPIDDYTHDIDLPSDLVLLPELGTLAARDDDDNELSWT